mmetsp:Transcript_30888/g.28071  ORF Transcript_30888/g.28071 Transcript_30888/m.28071 type:complete len:113 (+) Transcript_30888:1075-1413(+)
MSIGSVSKMFNKHHQAIEYYNLSIDIYKTLGLRYRSDIASNLSGIALAYRNLSQYEKCLESYEQLRHIYEELDEKISIANTLYDTAIVYKKLPDYRKATECYKKAEDMYKKI